METIRVEILNPKAKSLLKDLAALNLIRIDKVNVKSDFKEMLDKMRIYSDEAPSIEEIAKEVELARQNRYEK